MRFNQFINILCLSSALLYSSMALASGWEYLTRTFAITGDDQALTAALNTLGEEQWELVDCSETRGRLVCIFKRPLLGLEE